MGYGRRCCDRHAALWHILPECSKSRGNGSGVLGKMITSTLRRCGDLARPCGVHVMKFCSAVCGSADRLLRRKYLTRPSLKKGFGKLGARPGQSSGADRLRFRAVWAREQVYPAGPNGLEQTRSCSMDTLVFCPRPCDRLPASRAGWSYGQV